MIYLNVPCHGICTSDPGNSAWAVDFEKEKHPVRKVNTPVIQNAFLFIVAFYKQVMTNVRSISNDGKDETCFSHYPVSQQHIPGSIILHSKNWATN